MGRTPRNDEPRPEPPKPPRPEPVRKARDLAREDADSPHAIPLLPPQGDGS